MTTPATPEFPPPPWTLTTETLGSVVTLGSGKGKEAGLIATWHLMTVDQARLSKELCDLDGKQHVLDLEIREAADQQRHSSDVRQRDQAAPDEATYVAEMDRLIPIPGDGLGLRIPGLLSNG